MEKWREMERNGEMERNDGKGKRNGGMGKWLNGEMVEWGNG